MTISLYAAIIPSYRQVLGSVAGLLEKAEAFCAEKGLAPEAIVLAKLAEDMLPFAYQVKATAEHSLGAIEGVRKGIYSPDVAPPPLTFAALKAKIAHTLTAIDVIDPKEIESFIGRDMRFSFRDHHMDFTAEDYLLSFAQPNFYFHASTAYDILRWKGMPIGKKDFVGRLRLKT